LTLGFCIEIVNTNFYRKSTMKSIWRQRCTIGKANLNCLHIKEVKCIWATACACTVELITIRNPRFLHCQKKHVHVLWDVNTFCEMLVCSMVNSLGSLNFGWCWSKHVHVFWKIRWCYSRWAHVFSIMFKKPSTRFKRHLHKHKKSTSANSLILIIDKLVKITTVYGKYWPYVKI